MSTLEQPPQSGRDEVTLIKLNKRKDSKIIKNEKLIFKRKLLIIFKPMLNILIRPYGLKDYFVTFVPVFLIKWRWYLLIIGILTSFICLSSPSRVCGKSVCGDCSLKKINNDRVCDICFCKATNQIKERKKKEGISKMDEKITIYKTQLGKKRQQFEEFNDRKKENDKIVI